ncbi:TetR/AcrR family transcriptional regulator [Sunxiuqinia elliptica]|uniref:TetR family transcriptional regulator n=1 Tax=Sunxiuqinia elliptica TaxID=655355 RepID=A0A1I2EMD3_9BACT|nr:TetR/AcrR family transcriptional regulator [Sunxiuqinia elliptica]TDO04792.1 TetR family transcriptional regulator [Sunxiuqinia elliptica]TDO64339.1 TetR family transcriptional regulator [Sunxiuqinia elliptica]SFE93608.1 transcriptional regulator, TetR family [Sunxiuqinia elliptica]
MVDERTIVEKTYELYRKYGVKSVSVDEIAVALGISKKTLYQHIRSRDELLKLVVEHSLNKFSTELIKLVTPEENLIKKLALLYAFIVKSSRNVNPTFILDLKKVSYKQYLYVQEFRNKRLYDGVKSIYEQGVEEGIFRTNVDIRYVYYNQIYKVSEIAYKIFPDYDEASSGDTLYRLILNDIAGITTVKGHQVFDEIFDELLQLL